MIIPTDNNTTFIIADNSSEIARILPHILVEPLIILARIKGYKGIDDYVINLIEHELESIRDGGQDISDLGEYVIEYIEKIRGSGPYYDTPTTTPTTTAAAATTKKNENESLK
jgi:hypothetical protein